MTSVDLAAPPICVMDMDRSIGDSAMQATADVEGPAISIVLAKWTSDVLSFVHALRIHDPLRT